MHLLTTKAAILVLAQTPPWLCDLETLIILSELPHLLDIQTYIPYLL